MSEHLAGVEFAGSRFAGFRPPVAKFRAVCSCGWRSEVFLSRGDAQVAAVEHVVGHPPVRKPKVSRGAGGWPSGF